MKWLLAMGVALGVGGCGAPEPNCRAQGAVCAVTADCCSGFACLANGTCNIPGPTCHSSGQTCVIGSDCCTGLACLAGVCATAPSCKTVGQQCGTFVTNLCCAGLKCVGTTCAVPATCKSAGQTVTAADQCCANLTKPRFGSKCALGDIGDPCTSNGECLAALYCNGWCTKSCSSRAQCATVVDNPPGVNECAGATTGGFLCFPFCSSVSDCSIYGAGLTCAPGNSPSGGTSTSVCST